MIFYTLADAAQEIKSVVDGGACTLPTVYTRINQAMRRIMNRPKKPLHIRRLIRFYSYKDIITLPREVDRILHYTMDGVPAPLFSQAYEFVSGGPGELDGCDHCIAGKYLEDLGNQFSLMFDVPSRYYEEASSAQASSSSASNNFNMSQYTASLTGNPVFTQADLAAASANPSIQNITPSSEYTKYQPRYASQKIIAMSTAEADRDLSIYLVGRNGKNEMLGPNGTGAELKISRWNGGVEGEIFYNVGSTDLNMLDDVRDITWVRKPTTAGHISLYTFDPTTFQLYFLAKYMPHEINPRYRRYRITSPDYKYGSSIVAWCELGYVPQNHPDDVLIIQNIDALKMMVMALEMETERDFQMAKAYEADAYRLIEDQRNSERTHDYNLMQVSENYGFGDIRIR